MFQVARRLRERSNSAIRGPACEQNLRPQLERAMRHRILRGRYLSARFVCGAEPRAGVLQCSGTATLETGLLGIPSAIVYQCSRLQHLVARRAMYVNHIRMVNILLEEMVQPEFFHWRIDPEQVADEMWSLIADDARRGRIRRRLDALPEIMGPRGAIDRAAKAVLELMPRTTHNLAERSIGSADSEPDSHEARMFASRQ